MNIGLDLDWTLIKPVLETEALAYYLLGIPAREMVELEDFWHSNYPEPVRAKIHEIYTDPFYMNHFVEPVPGAVEKLREWYSKGHNIVIITAREGKVRKGTPDMVARLFKGIDGVLEFTTIKGSKREKMIENKLDLWVDDAPHGVETALELGIPSYLIDRGSNRSYKGKAIRVNSIIDVFPYSHDK